MSLKTQMLDDIEAILHDTDEFGESFEFAGSTVTGIVGGQIYTLFNGLRLLDPQAQTKILLLVMRADLSTVPAIGAVTTYRSAPVQVIDRQEPISGVLIYTLQ